MAKHPIGALLDFDPLATAEHITGQHTSENNGDNDAMKLGMVLALGHAQVKDHALRERGDTVLNNDKARYLDIIESIGFEPVFCLPFASRYGDEELLVYARRDGLLLKFDTFAGKSINGGKLWYNWQPSAEGLTEQRVLSSGHWMPRADRRGALSTDDIWSGDHDCREALLFNIDRLSKYGQFVSPWRERPFLWLLHYADTKVEGYDYAAINAERIAMLPDWVREMIGPDRERPQRGNEKQAPSHGANT